LITKRNIEMDHCKHCTVRGDIEACKSTPCSNHDDWYSKQLAARISELENEIEDLGYQLTDANNRD